MIIESSIVEDYIAGKNVDAYKEEWFYNNQGIVYNKPDYKKDSIEQIKLYFKAIKDTVQNFVPCNVAVWNTIFTGWKEIIDKVKINLIVGFPEPYDAVTAISPDGEINIIFDLAQWSKYGEKSDLRSTIHNFLTHELCHVCIGKIMPEIMKETDNYIDNLDAASFNEGFAHLVSYNDSDIDKVDWHSIELGDVSERSCRKMKTALSIKAEDEQAVYLNEAVCGSYYDKFACMCGMFYLVKSYENGGLAQLKKVFNEGYKGFAAKTVNLKQYYNAYDERYSDINHSFDKALRTHSESNKKINITATSCRVVNWDTLCNESAKAGLRIIDKGIVTDTPGFNTMLYAVVRGEE